jgi:hypothetical protein
MQRGMVHLELYDKKKTTLVQVRLPESSDGL